MYKHFHSLSQLYLILFLFLLPWESFSQKDTINTGQLTTQIDRLYSRIDSLQSKIDSLILNSKADRIDKASQVLQKQQEQLNSTMANGLSNYSLLFTLGGIIIPLLITGLGYLFAIRPIKKKYEEEVAKTKRLNAKTRKLNIEINNNLQRKFEEFVIDNRNKLIDVALENFRTDNVSRLPNSFAVLDAARDIGLNSTQVSKVIKLLKSDPDHDFSEFLATILRDQEDENTEEYFKEFIKQFPQHRIALHAAYYFDRYNKEQYLDLVAEIVIQKHESLTAMIANFYSKDFAIGLLNNFTLNEKIDHESVKFFGDFITTNTVGKLNKASIENTLFWKKYSEIKAESTK